MQKDCLKYNKKSTKPVLRKNGACGCLKKLCDQWHKKGLQRDLELVIMSDISPFFA